MKNASDCTSKTNQLRDQPSTLMQTSFRDARKATGRPSVSEDCHSGSQMDSLGTTRRKNFAVSETRKTPHCKRTPMPCGQLSYKNWYNWDWYNAQIVKKNVWLTRCALIALMENNSKRASVQTIVFESAAQNCAENCFYLILYRRDAVRIILDRREVKDRISPSMMNCRQPEISTKRLNMR